ncbi:hypothetical protein pmac_cds_759 [Pandoravirus macleodensis]|uniref:Uncharacterized protein n=1 Tax=Pandoravirus macleodensis TaxID=2107707 RepID=A0A2U7UG32_9VIRU|nr:hypothetical protein pmac_cds_759 [Pandoravirus macleodensis]AVK77447.1 hypothetical protein pmac_cds_759 [Pandoravirus macleodensis]
MGHSNSKSGGYRPLAPQGRSLTRDEWLVHTGMTQEEWIAKQHSTYDCLRSVPDDYVGPWDRAAAMAAVHTGRDEHNVLPRVAAGIRQWHRDHEGNNARSLKIKSV